DVEGPHPILPGDSFLICSDGLSGQLSDYEIGAILGALPMEEACEFFIELANLRGGPDNITVMIVRVGGNHESAAAPKKSPWPKLPWPVWTMVGGMGLAILAVLLHSVGLADGAFFVFIVAALAVMAGLGGLVLHTRKAKDSDFFDEDDKPLHVYARTDCRV